MIYLIDTIGKEVGMHLYNDAFVKAMQKAGLNSKVVSNYSGDYIRKLFFNFYRGNLIVKAVLFGISYFRMFIFFVRRRGNVFICQTYGMRFIDICFVFLFSFSRSFFVIVHDVYPFTPNDKPNSMVKLKRFVYKKIVKNVICHSEKTRDELMQLGFQGRIIYFPHFKYSFQKKIESFELSNEVITSIDKNKVNFLFFGQISITKGVDKLLLAINRIALNSRDDKINIIIAGSDKAKLVVNEKLPEFVKKICRYINDSELNYLFSKTDFLLLPYKKIYQSGVLDTAVYFHKPVILSDVPYFCDFIYKYPSFGEIVSPCTGNNLASMMNNVVQLKTEKVYFLDNDINQYHEDHDSKKLINKIKEQLFN